MNGVALLQTGAAAVLNGAFAWLAGVLFARAWLSAGHPALLSRLESALRRSGLAACAVGLLAGACVLWAATALMADTGLAQAVSAVPEVALATSYGRASLYALAALLACAVLLAGRWSGAAFGLSLLGFALARACVSHAGEHGMLTVPYALEVLHLVLVGVWAGGVALAAGLVLPGALAMGLAVPDYLRRLSGAAAVALGGIVATGAFAAWQRLAEPAELATHPYGQALVLKLVLFSLAALLGAYNRFAGFPLAAQDGGRRALAVLRIESGVFVLVLLAAARLTVQQPPG